MSSKRFAKVPLRRLTWAQWKVCDAFDATKYTTVYASIYAPRWETPFASLLIRITNGAGSVFVRFASVADAQQFVVIPEVYVERFEDAMARANTIADEITEAMQLAMHKRQLAQGAQIVRTDTGEVIAEAERIINI